MTKSDDKKVPALRFKGFTDDWEQRKLNYFLATSSQRNSKNIYNKFNVLSVSGKYGIVNQIKLQGRSFAGKSLSNYKIVNTNDIVYTKSPIKSNPYGIIRTNKQDKGIVSTLYAVYHPTKFVFPNFIELYFSNNLRLNKYLKPIVNIGAKHDMKVANEEVINHKVIFPTVNEQKAINELFLKLDKLLSLQQRKLKQLGLIKRALQQQLTSLFSNRNLTFIYQNNDWKNTTLNKILKERKELTTDSKIPLVSLTKEGVVPKNTRYNREFLVKEQNKKYKLTKSNDIVYNPANLKFGVISRNKLGTAKFSPIYVTFNVSNNFDPTYIEIVVTDPDFINYSLRFEEGTVYERKSVKPQDLLSIKIWCPDKFDQFKVAKLYNQVTNDIKYNKLKLKSYYKLKKNLLQTLFI